jgi:multimeric flavodoxin WrbA
MKAVAINGSPRKGGNTEALLRAVLEPLDAAGWETKFIQVGGQKIRGCMACWKCMENRDRQCAIKKDVFNAVVADMLDADALILGSPTYFTDVTAEMKALLDRSGVVALANGGAFAGKIGAAVVAVRRGGATHVFDTINHMFLMNGVIVPGSSYWNMGYGLHPGEVLGDAEALRNMRHLGQAVAWLGAAVKPRMGEYPALPSIQEG